MGWDGIYHRTLPESLPWEVGRPRSVLVELVDSQQVVPGKTLDLCCGMGTNPVYLAQRGFDVTALDISDKAIEYAKEKATKSGVKLQLLIGDYLWLPFRRGEFDFTFDFGCFHHVKKEDRVPFIKGLYTVLKPEAAYLMVCFSNKNGTAWNHFTKKQIYELFGDAFKFRWLKHVSSIEGDEVTRYFYEALMKRK